MIERLLYRLVFPVPGLGFSNPKRWSRAEGFFFFFFTLVTGPRRSLSLKLSDTKVYEPQIRARLGNHNLTILGLQGRRRGIWRSRCRRRASRGPTPATSRSRNYPKIYPKPAIGDPRHETRDPKPEIRDPRSETRDPRPETRDPRPETRDPRPETRTLNLEP